MILTASQSTTPARLATNARRAWDRLARDGEVTARHGTGEPHTVEANLRDIINAEWPEYYVKGKGGSKTALTFHTEISIYLKYSGNAVLIRHAGPGQKSRWQMAAHWTEVPDDVVLNRARHSGQHSGASSQNPVRRVIADAPEIMMPEDPDLCPPGCPGRGQWGAGVKNVPGHAWKQDGSRGYLAHVPEGNEKPLPPAMASARPCGDCGAVGSEPCANPVTGESLADWHSARGTAILLTPPPPGQDAVIPEPLKAAVVNDPVEIVRHLVNRNTLLEAENRKLEKQVASANAETAKYRQLFADLADALEIMKDAIKAVENRGG